jgi:TatD DNase family protein
MTLTDTHCHLNFERFDPDRQAVLERAFQAGVGRILIPGLDLASSRSAVELAHSHPPLYAAVGIHPSETSGFAPASIEELKELAQDPKVKAVGEIGLDYYWETSSHALQQKVLVEQLDLAAELDIPVVIHFREKGDASSGACTADLLKILENWVAGLVRRESPLATRSGVLHSFSGTLETARTAVKLGFYLGVAGPVTYKNALARQELVAALPMDRILIETDSPFQAPHPHRGKRNEPAYVRLIADKIALVRSSTIEQVISTTGDNARRLFAWD